MAFGRKHPWPMGVDCVQYTTRRYTNGQRTREKTADRGPGEHVNGSVEPTWATRLLRQFDQYLRGE